MKRLSYMMDIYSGMTEQELIKSCKPSYKRLALRINWTAEIYSFGKCFRALSGFPDLLPLCFTTDHGVGMETNFFLHERGARLGLHMTWNRAKYERNKNDTSLNILHVPHPWILYRRMKKIERRVDHSGTLIFFTHHAPGSEWTRHDEDSYFERVRELPQKFHPIVFCVHMHDINAGNHHKILKHNFPVVTAGNTLSDDFVDHFYDIASRFSYASSQQWGSQTAYCIEMGLPYFFLGERPVLINHSDENIKIGEVGFQDSFHESNEMIADAIFRAPVDAVTQEQMKFVESFLGLDSVISQKSINWIFWRQFVLNFDKVLLQIFERIKLKIRINV
jgi:hypothetical protein